MHPIVQSQSEGSDNADHDSFSDDYHIDPEVEKQAKERIKQLKKKKRSLGIKDSYTSSGNRFPTSDGISSMNYSEIDLNAHRQNPKAYKRVYNLPNDSRCCSCFPKKDSVVTQKKD
jgi:hypothetical protein